MNPERILVTGANGFVAPYLIASLVHNEPRSKILGISRHLPKPGKVSLKPVAFRSVDLANFGALEKVIRSFRPTQVYHLAGLSSVADSFKDPCSIFHVNVEGTANLLESLVKTRLKPQVLLISTGQVYGRTFLKKQSPSEQDPILPMSPYALSKRMMEELGLYYFHNYGLPVMIARPFNHFGPGQKPNFSLASFAAQFAKMKKGKESKLFVGNIDISRDFSDVRNVVRAYQLILKKGKAGEIYNVGSGASQPLRRVIRSLERLSDTRVRIISRLKLRPLDIPVMRADIRKIIRLGWGPRYPFLRSLEELLRSYQAQ